MLTGERPSDRGGEGLRREPDPLRRARDERLHLTTRVIASTQSDMHSAVAGGVGALKGPLHGGAGEAVMRTLMEIGEVASVDALRRARAAREAAPHGFRAPRLHAPAIPARPFSRAWPRRRAGSRARFKWFEMAVKLHDRIGKAKGLIPNVDFYSAPLFYSLGIPVDLFTPVIAAGRIAGWTANIIEQCDDNRLIRPRADYVGPQARAWVVRVEQR